MLQSNLKKKSSKAEVEKKIDAWKTLNSVLVQANSEFMHSLRELLTDKSIQRNVLERKLQEGTGTEQDNAEYLFTGGYIQCLLDILNGRSE